MDNVDKIREAQYRIERAEAELAAARQELETAQKPKLRKAESAGEKFAANLVYHIITMKHRGDGYCSLGNLKASDGIVVKAKQLVDERGIQPERFDVMVLFRS